MRKGVEVPPVGGDDDSDPTIVIVDLSDDPDEFRAALTPTERPRISKTRISRPTITKGGGGGRSFGVLLPAVVALSAFLGTVLSQKH